MSLCVAWKYEDGHGCRVYFAADSCAVMEAGKHVMPHGGIKIMEIPIQIFSATDEKLGKAELLFSQKYGMAFAGSYFTAFLMKELVAEVLTHSQFLGTAEFISFTKICDFVLRFHKHFHEKIRDHLTTDYEVDFFLGGYCPQAKKIRVAKFFVDLASGQPNYSEILQATGFTCETIGVDSGQKRFTELMNLSLSGPPCRTHFAAFRRLWDVIRDPEIPLVAGAVQYGEFENNDFKMFGAYDVKFENGRMNSRMYVRGTDVDAITLTYQPQTLHIGYTYGNLFDEDVKSFDTWSAFWEADGTGHVMDEQITVLTHDLKWQQWFEEEAGFLRAVLGDTLPIDHIGSTAVSGMAALPCVDILIGIKSLGDVKTPPCKLTGLGYEYMRDVFVGGQRYYRKRGARSFNLHLVEHGGAHWTSAIKLRDYLRQNSADRDAYSREKIRILNAGSWTLVRYLRQRANYLAQLLARSIQ